MAVRRRRAIGWLGLLLLLAACGRGADGPDPPPGGLALSFEDRPAPAVFERETVAIRDAPDGAPGFWAAVPALPSPERAEVARLEGRRGKPVVVALFGARGSADEPVRLSNEAADMLRIGDEPVRVRVTAVRQLPAIEINRR